MTHHERLLAPERLLVLDVDRFPRLAGRVTGSWSCTRCGREHPASDSWTVVFDTVRGPRTMVLCAACASDYERPEPDGGSGAPR